MLGAKTPPVQSPSDQHVIQKPPFPPNTTILNLHIIISSSPPIPPEPTTNPNLSLAILSFIASQSA